MLRVVLADDVVFFREMLALALRDAGMDIVAETGDVPTLTAAVAELEPDVVIVDVRMPPSYSTEGLRAAVQLRAHRPRLGVLVLSAHLETTHLAALLEDGHARGVGYLLKERVSGVLTFADAVREVAAGQYVVDEQVVSAMLTARRSRICHLTPREKQVLALIAEGHSNTAIHEQLNLKLRSVESHIRNILVKLDIAPADDYNHRVLAVLKYLQSGDRGAGR